MIEDNKIVKVIYDLYVDGKEAGQEELMESATAEYPLVYCHGKQMMLPQFEQQLAGKQVGDEFDFRIAAQDAYGEYDDEAVLALNKELFFIDGKFDEERVYEGNIVPMNTVDGRIVNAQVVEVGEDKVTIDLNHPLAGENLHFKGKILDVRDATEEEIAKLTRKCGGCGGGCGGGGCNNEDCGNGCDCNNCE